MAFESIISGELARQAQGSRDIQNIFAQFGAGIEQGRQQRAQQEAGMQIAEQEIAAMSKIDPSIAEQFMSVAETGKPQDIINFANAAKAGLALSQQQEQLDLSNKLANLDIQAKEQDVKTGGIDVATKQRSFEDFQKFDRDLAAAVETFSAGSNVDEATRQQAQSFLSSFSDEDQNAIMTAASQGVPSSQIYQMTIDRAKDASDPDVALAREGKRAAIDKTRKDMELIQANIDKASDPATRRLAEIELKTKIKNLQLKEQELKDMSREQKQAQDAKVRQVFTALSRSEDVVSRIGDIKELIKNAPKTTTGLFARVTEGKDGKSNFLGKFFPVDDIRRMTSKLKAEAGFMKIEDLRSQGIKLGNLAIQELENLQKTAGNLDPAIGDDAAFIKELDAFQNSFDTAVMLVAEDAANSGIQLPADMQARVNKALERRDAAQQKRNASQETDPFPPGQEVEFQGIKGRVSNDGKYFITPEGRRKINR